MHLQPPYTPGGELWPIAQSEWSPFSHSGVIRRNTIVRERSFLRVLEAEGKSTEKKGSRLLRGRYPCWNLPRLSTRR